jgi:Asp-tRNA(Asn)/Glu-tRNA(Gln) amidotransferase A subunit family amidase
MQRYMHTHITHTAFVQWRFNLPTSMLISLRDACSTSSTMSQVQPWSRDERRMASLLRSMTRGRAKPLSYHHTRPVDPAEVASRRPGMTTSFLTSTLLSGDPLERARAAVSGFLRHVCDHLPPSLSYYLCYVSLFDRGKADWAHAYLSSKTSLVYAIENCSGFWRHVIAPFVILNFLSHGMPHGRRHHVGNKATLPS